ncbi:MAG: hypothetical protein QME48_08855 [bacterium]|nr:hypothetical protein [bacterium]
MDNREYNEDYRKFMISRWVASNIETFKKPLKADLDSQSKYYIYLIDKFIPRKLVVAGEHSYMLSESLSFKILMLLILFLKLVFLLARSSE